MEKILAIVNKEQIRECYDFAVVAWDNRSQSQKQFGTKEARTRNSFVADQISGKLAEYIFKHSIEELFDEVRVDLNFDHYLDPLHTDMGDVEIYIENKLFPIRIDVKGSSYRAQWLLVELHKFRDLKTREPMSDKFVMVKFSENVPDNRTLRNNPEVILELNKIEGNVIGWANHSDFISETDNEEWFVYLKGEKPFKTKVLPKSPKIISNIKHLRNYINKVKRDSNLSDDEACLNMPLDAEKNIGLPIHWLQKNLDGIFIPTAIENRSSNS
ncbi:MAG: hypothetical protein R3250_15230 [Melioribacteraceae bacterium]|nr:hypothetical protein [Melioribacteraceae bacterium]